MNNDDTGGGAGPSMIALDLDGTLLDYSPEGERPAVNWAVIRALAARGVCKVAIVTNQGGLPWFVMDVLRKDGRPYPSPAQFLNRLAVAVDALSRYGIKVDDVRVSCYHPRADEAAIQRTATEVRAGIQRAAVAGNWRVYTTARARKPQPLMLRSVGATEYWGDSPEDGGAARAAGVPFVKVDRFFG